MLTIPRIREDTYKRPGSEWMYRVEVIRKAGVRNAGFDGVMKGLLKKGFVEILPCLDNPKQWWAFRLTPQGEAALLAETKPYVDAAKALLLDQSRTQTTY